MATMRSTTHAHADGDDASRTDREQKTGKQINVSGKIIRIEKVTRSARCAKVDVAYGHIKQERSCIQRKQK